MPDDAPDPGVSRSASVLHVNLSAVAENYRLLKSKLGSTQCGAAVKADAYGLGMTAVAPALVAEGCRAFFVATIDEGIELRNRLPSEEIAIIVFGGILAGTEDTFVEHRLTPVANDPGQIDLWRTHCHRLGQSLDAMLHVDTGMNRLGLSPSDLDRVAAAPEVFEGPNWTHVISHLACADEPQNPANEAQLARFEQAKARLPEMKGSFANSGGVFLGPRYHFDLARPGIALYGGNPTGSAANPMRQTVRVLGRILQVRNVTPGMTVGYGGTYEVTRPGRVATVAAGYADGYLRSGSGTAHVYLGQTRLPVIGRISMDVITVDVTSVPPEDTRPGKFMELLGDQVTPDDAGDAAGTISYEFLTSLGRRYHRIYAPPSKTA
jgi:alanine racemase